MKRLLIFLAVSAILAATPTWAHDYWLKPDGSGAAVLIYGHANEVEAYKAEVVKAVGGWAIDGAKKELVKAFAKGQLKVSGSGVSTFAVEIDNGYWTKTIQGWKNVSKRQQPKYIKSTWDRHFAKLVDVKNLDQVVGHPLEIVLSSASAKGIEGKVLLNGKPTAGIAVEWDHKKLGTTDAGGKFSTRPKGSGLVVLSARKQEKLEGNADADFLNLDATLTVKL